MQDVVEIKTGMNPTDSEFILLRFHDEGIPAEMVDANSTNTLPHYAFTSVGVKIIVPRKYAQRAEDILQEHYDKLNAQHEALDKTCPKCNSQDTKISKSNFFTNLLGIFTLLPTRTTWGKKRTCNNCGHQW